MKTGEDSALLLAVSERYPGVWLDQYTLIYRMHKDSAMHSDSYWTIERPRNQAFNLARLEAIKEVSSAR